MANLIIDKYFTQQNFADHADEALRQVCAETGLKVEQELFRGKIYDEDKVGSIIYRGTWQSQPAVLKLQGLRPEIEEVEMLREFTAQNQSARIRVPEIFVASSWDSGRGFGYIIMEHSSAPKIFSLPFASAREMRSFADFYQEYRTKAVTQPWIQFENITATEHVLNRLDKWEQIARAQQIIPLETLAQRIARFREIVAQLFSALPMVFSHRHLTANDIDVLPQGRFMIFSNLFWSYKPQYYDLAFNVWACLKSIRDPKYSFDEFLKYVDDWLAVYRTMPIAARDKDFEKKFFLNMLERTMGALIIDLPNDLMKKGRQDPATAEMYQSLASCHERFFDHLSQAIE